MTGMADDVIKRLENLALRRSSHERNWREVQAVAAPDASEFSMSPTGASTDLGIAQRTTADRSRKLYDSTAVWAVDRLASGIEALVIPQSEYWHTLGVESITGPEPSLEEGVWLDSVRDLMFDVRYDADSGWVSAAQTAMRRMVAFGNGFVMSEESMSNDSFIKYWFVPLAGCFIAVDRYGVVDTFYRPFQYTAVQAAMTYGNKVSPKILKAANDPAMKDQRYRFIQCISPRGDFSGGLGVLGTKWKSLHIEVESRLVVKESGYFEFPITDFRWLPEPTQEYGEGPIQKALADIQAINAMAKNELIAGQQSINPPLLLAHSGVMNRPNSAPGALTYGGLSPNGTRQVEPMFTGQRLDFATKVLEAKKMQLKESLYINLFQVLVQNPEMSATEALIRANEKGELLGPAGSRIQQSLSRMIERELGILSRRGLYERGSRYAPPRSAQARRVKPKFRGPLDRLRQAGEVKATMDVLNIMAPLAQTDPSVVDKIDTDATFDGLASRLGMPRSFLRKKEDVDSIRQGRAEQQSLAASAAVAKDMASAGKQGVDALNSLTGG